VERMCWTPQPTAGSSSSLQWGRRSNTDRQAGRDAGTARWRLQSVLAACSCANGGFAYITCGAGHLTVAAATRSSCRCWAARLRPPRSSCRSVTVGRPVGQAYTAVAVGGRQQQHTLCSWPCAQHLGAASASSSAVCLQQGLTRPARPNSSSRAGDAMYTDDVLLPTCQLGSMGGSRRTDTPGTGQAV
jgi:hypothetical protein